MVFPDSPRVVYEKNPLDQVVCQLRFPTILKIASEAPSEFQERVRKEYPLFGEKGELNVPFPPEIARLLSAELGKASEIAYEFTSEDENWAVSLTKGFVALTSKSYERWESFREHLRNPLKALLDVYKPTFFSRTGLRYIDVIQRSRLGCANDEWRDLLNPQIAAELADPEISELVKNSVHEFEVAHEPATSVRIRHGLTQHKQTNETCYIIDADFFTERRLKGEDVIDQLNEFNRDAGRLFRWCISERLHNAMGPRPLG